jgi:hypothetical protein
MIADFFDEGTEQFDPKNLPFEKRFVNKSTWKPKIKDLSTECKKTIRAIQTSTSTILSTSETRDAKIITHHKSNLTKQEWLALKQLKQNPDIIIKPADKGGNIVIMNTQDYINEGLRQLSDQQYYTELTEPLYESNIQTLDVLIKSLHSDHFITSKQMNYLLPDTTKVRPRQFYLLPKIHKTPSSWPNPAMPPGRPIVSDVSSESYRISEFLDYFLLPLSTTHKSYIKDTYDFVEKINNVHVKPTTILFTADVTSLYTNMDLQHTLHLVTKAFKQHPSSNRPDHHLLAILKLTLYNNDFLFNGKTYLQTRGIPMGKKYAPALANLYMAEYDTLFTTHAGTNLMNYFRFLDDLFGTWDGTREELLDIFNQLNNIIPGITVTPTIHDSHIDFLDTTIYKQTFNNITTLHTTIYFKPTATHQLLHTQSFHPEHTHKGVLKSQLIRFGRICSNRLQYDAASELLFQSLFERGYQRKYFAKLRREIWDNQLRINQNQQSSSQQSLSNPKPNPEPKPQPNTTTIPMVLPFSGIAKELLDKWKQDINLNLGTKIKTIKAYKNNKSLRQHLISSKIHTHPKPNPNPNPNPKPNPKPSPSPSPKPNSNPDTQLEELIFEINRQENLEYQSMHTNPDINTLTKCTSTKCKLCNIHIKETSTITSTINKKTFNIIGKLNCKTKNLVYVITCAKCGIQYVGETGRPAADRLTDHRSAIKTNKNTPIGLHFNITQHKVSDLIFTPVQSLKTNNIEIRKKLEKSWCEKMDTYFPNGLNNMPI